MRLRILPALPLLLECSGANEAPQQPPVRAEAVEERSPPSRIVALGDLRGNLEAAKRALTLAQVMDATGHWSGGTTTLVQTGDFLHPGSDTKALLALFQALETEAAAAGGQVTVLLGDHEVDDLLGHWKKAPADLPSFGGAEARTEALSSTAPEGRWLRSRGAAVELGGTTFVHGGIAGAWRKVDLAPLSSQLRAAIAGTGPPLVLEAQAPIRYRGYHRNDPVEACVALEDALRDQGSERMVVGHGSSPVPEARCGGRLVLLGPVEPEDPAIVEFSGRDARILKEAGPLDLRAAEGALSSPKSR